MAPSRAATEPRGRRLVAPALLAAAVLTTSVLLHLRDPHRSGSWGFCPWLVLTGTYCPGCGSLRAVNDLTRGDVSGALSSNLLLVAAIPWVIVIWGRSVRDRWIGREHPVRGRPLVAILGFVAVALAFTLVRNLSFGAWLAP